MSGYLFWVMFGVVLGIYYLPKIVKTESVPLIGPMMGALMNPYEEVEEETAQPIPKVINSQFDYRRTKKFINDNNVKTNFGHNRFLDPVPGPFSPPGIARPQGSEGARALINKPTYYPDNAFRIRFPDLFNRGNLAFYNSQLRGDQFIE